MTLKIEVKEGYDHNDDLYCQKVICEDPRISYYVSNLWDCPEDACIRRDLVSAYEYIDFIKLGMQLAREGYTDIEVTTTKAENMYEM